MENPHFSWVNQRTKLPWLQVRKLLVIARGYHNPHPRDLHSKSEVTRWGPPRYKLGWMRQPIPRHSEWKVLMMLMFGQACSQHPGWFWGGLGNTSAKSRIFGTQLAITYLEWVGTTLFGVRHFERVAHFLIQGMTRQYLEMWQFHGQHWVPIQQSELVFWPTPHHTGIYSDVWVHKHWLPNYLAPRRTLSSRYTRESQFSKWVSENGSTLKKCISEGW